MDTRAAGINFDDTDGFRRKEVGIDSDSHFQELCVMVGKSWRGCNSALLMIYSYYVSSLRITQRSPFKNMEHSNCCEPKELLRF